MPAMSSQPKTEQLQIRVSKAQKQEIVRQAQRARMSMSDWVLARLLPDARQRFVALNAQLVKADQPGFVLAEINDFLTGLNRFELAMAVASDPGVKLDQYLQNYLAAMIEQSCLLNGTEVPLWLAAIKPLLTPRFATELVSVRLHLLRQSPPTFRNRNIFIDTSVGGRV